jgi:hypothetical protein
MNTIVKYKTPESHLEGIKNCPVSPNINEIEGVLYFHIQDKISHKYVDTFLDQFEYSKLTTIVTFSYQVYEMFYVKIKQKMNINTKVRVLHIHPRNYQQIARYFWQYRVVVCDEQSRIQDLIDYKIKVVEELKNKKKETKQTETISKPKPVYMLCPSFGKQCGIGEYSEEILRGQFDIPVWGVTHTSQITDEIAPVIIQHEFALYDPATHLSTETETVLIHFMNKHKGRMYLAMHTMPDIQLFPRLDSKALLLMKTVQKNTNISVIVFNEQMKANLLSVIPIENERVIVIDLGLPVLEYPIIHTGLYANKTIGIIGFNSGGKDQAIQTILDKTDYKLILIGKGYDAYLNNKRIQVVSRFLPNNEFDKMILEDVLVGLSHRRSSGYSSSASYRRLLALGIPTVAADVPEHNYIKQIHKNSKTLTFYTSENEMIQQINQLMKDRKFYDQQQAVLRELKSFTTHNQWKPIIEGAYA